MLSYNAIYRYENDGVHAEVLDFPGVITCGSSLDEARVLLRAALVDMAETLWLEGSALPRPEPGRVDSEADLQEPIHLLLRASTRVAEVPAEELLETA